MNYYRDAVVRIIKDNLHERRSNLMTNTFLSNKKLVVKQCAGYLAIAPNAVKSEQTKGHTWSNAFLSSLRRFWKMSLNTKRIAAFETKNSMRIKNWRCFLYIQGNTHV